MLYNKSDKYKYVYFHKTDRSSTKNWRGQIGKNVKCFEEEKEAAKWVDLQLIEQGKEPVNILVRKVNKEQ